LTVLERRLATGEISLEQFAELRAALGGGESPPAALTSR